MGKCCKDVAQTKGKVVEPWPKNDPPPPAWRCECPRDPQPPNYDPYRIKVPDIVVPPLPPSNAKMRARPSYKDINMLAELLGFPETECTPPLADELKDHGPCINNWRVF